MYRVKFIPLLLIVSFLVGSISCRKEIQSEFEDPNKIPVINSILRPGKQVEVHVTYTSNVNSPVIETIEDAIISLYVNGEYIEDLDLSENGIYKSTGVVESGKRYTCEASVPGFEKIICSDSVPQGPVIFGLRHINEAGMDEEGITYPAIQLNIHNNTNVQQYFKVNIRLFSGDEEWPANLEKITDPILINEGLPIALFSDTQIPDTSFELTLNYTTGMTSRSDDNWQTTLYPLIVEVRSISHSYYEYAKSAYLYEQGRYPDGLSAQTTVFNTYSNIDGAYGIFAGYSFYQSDTIYPNN